MVCQRGREWEGGREMQQLAAKTLVLRYIGKVRRLVVWVENFSSLDLFALSCSIRCSTRLLNHFRIITLFTAYICIYGLKSVPRICVSTFMFFSFFFVPFLFRFFFAKNSSQYLSVNFVRDLRCYSKDLGRTIYAETLDDLMDLL